MRRRPSSTCGVAAISASSWFAFAPDPVSSSQESKAMSEVQSYIAGEWCRGNAAELTVVNPSTEEVIGRGRGVDAMQRSEEHTSELPSLMRHSYAVFCLKKKRNNTREKTDCTQEHNR